MYVHWVAVGGSVVSAEQMATRKVVYHKQVRTGL